ncbi:MAG TPA: SLC13 family permease [Oscillospiraceae bacterium]|nr:SLC13 family permease [Oscillospiraceae bacterium]HPS75980.1 SLC13 family permease [Oscillospiraceae bacterium]
MIVALVIFAVTYALLLALPRRRAWIALASGALFIALGILPVGDVASAIDWNVLMMIAGTMGIVSLFIDSGMPALMADVLLDRMPNVKWTIVAMAMFAGIVSAFVDNVATVLMIAPVALAIAKKFKISPVAMVIAISVSSNLQGAATLVGDTTSILLGGYARMDFMDFFVFRGKPGMFWIVECGALLTMLVLLWLFRKETQPTSAAEHTKVTDYLPTVLLCGTIVLLIAASFIPGKPAVTNGLICLSLFAVGLVVNCIKTHSLSELKKPLMDIDFTTLLLLMGLFVVIGGITQAGVIDAIAALFTKIGGGSLFLIYTLIVWASVLFSAFIDNIPYVATMLPVVQGIAASMGVEPYLLYFGLLTGATLGGNLTPIGASANITAIGILRRDGYEVKTSDFMRIGVPFSLTAVVSGYVLLWIFWH